MTTWFRVMCDRHGIPTPVCDLERTDDTVNAYPQFAVRVDQLVDPTPLEERVRARSEAMGRGEQPPQFHTGLVRTANPDVTRGTALWLTCELCQSTGGKKLSARAQPDVLAWVLDRIAAELVDTVDVELREPVPRAQWEADPSQPRYTVQPVTMRVLSLARLQSELADNPRGASSE